MEEANLRLGELNAFSTFVPDVDVYFIKPYITPKFRNYFELKESMTIDSFVIGNQVWTARDVKQQFSEYEKINLRQLSVSNLSKLE